MPDSQEYRRNLASGQNMAATTQEYKMAQDREKILKALNEKYKGRDDLSDEQIANSIQRDNPDLSMDVITKTVSSNRERKTDTRNLSDKGYPSTLYDADMRKPDTRNLSEKGYPSTLYDADMRKQKPAQDREQILKDIGWDDVDLSNPVENAPTSNQSSGNAATQSTGTQPSGTTSNQNQTTPTPDAMAGHYSRDPNQATTKPEEKEEGGEEKEPKDRTGFLKNFSLLGNVFGARNPNNVLFDRRDMMRGLADEATNMAATLGMQGQSWRQEANRNPYSEASKKASATNAQQMAANISANSATGQNQVGLVRMNNPMDVNAEEQKRAEARRLADERQEKQRTTEGQARAYLGEAQQLNTQGRNLSADELESRRLSLGNGGAGVTTTEEKDETKPAEETPTEETPEETPVEETPEQYNTNWQHVLDYITFGNDKTSGWSNDSKDGGNARKYAEKMGWKPITLTQAEYDAQGTQAASMRQQKVKQQAPEFYAAWQKGSQRFDEKGKQINAGDNGKTVKDFEQATVSSYASGTKNAKPGYAIVGENGPEIVKMKGGEEVIPNDRAERIISDERIKLIKTCIDLGLGITPDDITWLSKKQGGKYNHNGKEYDFFNDDDWTDDTDDSVINGYADNIKNYLYTYKPEAQEIDVSIDPEQEHIGPMAQDIEKVNPACIVETPEGVKTVDTGRLAMMNAGAIGDLARQLRELKEVFIK